MDYRQVGALTKTKKTALVCGSILMLPNMIKRFYQNLN